jgi:hypothetical protein
MGNLCRLRVPEVIGILILFPHYHHVPHSGAGMVAGQFSFSSPQPSSAGAFDRARQLCREAEYAIARAAADLAESARIRAETRRWHSVLEACRARPDHLVTCCAYCSRLRVTTGEWVAIPPNLRSTVYRSRELSVSHSICPECMANQEAVSGQRSAVSGQRSAVSGQRSAVSGQRSQGFLAAFRMTSRLLSTTVEKRGVKSRR